MTNLSELEGQFQKKGHKLVKSDLTLLVSERSQTTNHKTRFFLISLRGNAKDRYISSLYPDGDEGHFWFEYKGQQYNLTIDGESANIGLKMESERA